MLRSFMFLLLTSISGMSYATCSGSSIVYGTPITIDLSDKLSPATPTWTGSFSTQYSGSFNCTTGNSEFSYTPILSTDSKYATILGFSNNKYMVRAEITNPPANKTLTASGSHTASELNTPFTVRFTLVNQSGEHERRSVRQRHERVIHLGNHHLANQSGHQDSAVVIQRVQVALRQPRYVWSTDDHQIRAETDYLFL